MQRDRLLGAKRKEVPVICFCVSHNAGDLWKTMDVSNVKKFDPDKQAESPSSRYAHQAGRGFASPSRNSVYQAPCSK
jgi:hypothetical protein